MHWLWEKQQFHQQKNHTTPNDIQIRKWCHVEFRENYFSRMLGIQQREQNEQQKEPHDSKWHSNKKRTSLYQDDDIHKFLQFPNISFKRFGTPLKMPHYRIIRATNTKKGSGQILTKRNYQALNPQKLQSSIIITELPTDFWAIRQNFSTADEFLISSCRV